ncbi:MAG: class I SAM-dependent DNA methyltransferase [Solirubrobacterales bacterium]
MARERGEERPRWAEAAYEAIAPVYDEFTAHHDYDLWLGQLLPKVEQHGIPGRRLLDVACGTGKSFIPMLEKGWEVTACDVSPKMVAIAREKVGDRAALSVADMRDLPVFGEFDLVFCLDDAVNYLLGTEELEQALTGMRRNLGPGGLLMFDVNTLEAYRTFFAEEMVVERDGLRMIWKGRSTPEMPPSSIAEASFEAESLGPEAAPSIAPGLHRERHFTEAEVLEALERAGLECLDVYGHHHDAIPKQPLDDLTHTKGVYIARAR